MSHFRLHTNTKGREYLKYLILALCCLMAAGAMAYGIHSIGQARARSRETVLIYTEEEFRQYLVDRGNGEYNLNGRYQLEENLDLRELDHSIGTNLEPFTGKLDGNGHVIRGLSRPLFGVLKEAEVENLFFSEADIIHPFTYYDGEHYVDGYGALAAYAVDSVIRNCGMGGEIHMASPVEAEYQVAKASPADAMEEKGPGETEHALDGDIAGEGGSGNSGGPGVEPGTGEGAGIESETASETAGGPGVESETGKEQGNTDETGSESSGNGGPGMESEPGESTGTEPGKEPGTESGAKPGTEPGTSGGTGTEPGTAGGREPESGNAAEPGSEPETNGSQAAESGSAIEGMETKGETEAGVEAGTDGKSETDQEVNSGTGMESGTNTEQETEQEQESGSGMESEGDYGANSNTGSGQAAAETGNGSSTGERLQTDGDAKAETIGYQSNDRQHLMMKMSTEPEPGPGAEETDPVPVASPSDATPSDAEESAEEPLSPDGPVEPEHTETSEGDRYILVTADRIRAGGLVAETKGNTLISDSFVLVTIGGWPGNTDSCAGGLAGVLGENARTENSYASGLMEYPGMAGGFAAVNRGTVQNCYSTVTVGAKETIRGAFVAENSGAISDCVYDRQMASVVEEMEDSPWVESYEAENEGNAESESGLTGLEIADMTGLESQVPGTWYLADQAYPQIEYFAGSEDETISSYSKASVISLPLPSGMTLLELPGGSDIQLPSQVDGQPIQWDAKGGAIIDENNQAKIETSEITISPNEVPIVKTALEQEMTQVPEQETAASEETPTAGTAAEEPPESETESPSAENTVPTQDPTQEKESAAVEETTSSNVVFEATVGTATRTLLANTMAVAPAAAYGNWLQVGNAIYNSNRPAGAGTASNPFLLGTPENLAWFTAHVYKGNYTACAKLTANIDMTGKAYGGSDAAPLSWWMIAPGTHGEVNGSYQGTFDGQYYTISSLAYTGNELQIGFMGVLSGVVRNLYLDKIKFKSVNPRKDWVCMGGITGQTVPNGKIERCGVLSGTVEIEHSSIITFLTMGGLVGDYRPTSSLKDCFNRANLINRQQGAGLGIYIGGVTGRAGADRIKNCYSTGTITINNRETRVDGLSAWGGSADTLPVNCYIENGVRASTSAKTLSKANLQSWAVCYTLNEQKRVGPWQYNAGGYPDFGHPADNNIGALTSPPDWSYIGKGLADGFLTTGKLTAGNGSAGNPYQISTPEQLAHFAYLVNQGGTGLCAKLTADINLFGSTYTGTTYAANDSTMKSKALPWKPMRASGTSYTGTFMGNGHTISLLHTEGGGGTEPQGLFGVIGGSGKVTGTGLRESLIVGEVAGGIAGRIEGSAEISQCYIRKSSSVKGSGRSGEYCGGITGQMKGTSKIKDCYTIDTIIMNVGSGSYAGGITGGILEQGGVYNSYSAIGKNGMIDSTKTPTMGRISAVKASGGTIEKCYTDLPPVYLADKNEDIKMFTTTTDAAIQAAVDDLNILLSPSRQERTGTSRMWYTSLAVEETHGKPTFIAPKMLSVSVNPAAVSANTTGATPVLTGSTGTMTGATLPASLKFRGTHLEKSSDETYTLTKKSDVTTNYFRYGTANANKNLALVAGTTDLGSLTPSLTSPSAALNAGSFNKLTLFNGGAYTHPSARTIIVDLAEIPASGTPVRYEIRVTIAGVTGKTLSVVMRTPGEIQLTPGKESIAYTQDLKLENKCTYPLQLSIASVTPKAVSNSIDLELKPVEQVIDLMRPLVTEGIRLGIAKPLTAGNDTGAIQENKFYYIPPAAGVQPPATAKWISGEIEGNSTLWYRYFMEYSHLYLGPGDERFGYEINYRFQISPTDVNGIQVAAN